MKAKLFVFYHLIHNFCRLYAICVQNFRYYGTYSQKSCYNWYNCSQNNKNYFSIPPKGLKYFLYKQQKDIIFAVFPKFIDSTNLLQTIYFAPISISSIVH